MGTGGRHTVGRQATRSAAPTQHRSDNSLVHASPCPDVSGISSPFPQPHLNFAHRRMRMRRRFKARRLLLSSVYRKRCASERARQAVHGSGQGERRRPNSQPAIGMQAQRVTSCDIAATDLRMPASMMSDLVQYSVESRLSKNYCRSDLEC